MEELLSAEERNALLGTLVGGPSAAPPVTLAVFPSVTQLDPERTYALVSRVSKWLERRRVLACPAPEPGGFADPEGALNWLRVASDIECGTIAASVSLIVTPSTARALVDPPPSSASILSPAAIAGRLGDVPVEV